MADTQLNRPRRFTTLAAAALLGAVMTLAGCTASSGDAATQAPGTVSRTVTETRIPSTTAPTTAPATSTVTTTASSTEPRSSASSSHSAGSACVNGQVKVTVGEPNGASEHNGYPIRFRNISDTTCTLHGYPGFDALRAARPPVHATRTLFGFFGGSHHGLPTVRLAPGHVASALVEYSEVSTGNAAEGCPSTRRVAITVPNTTRAVVLHAQATLCTLQIHPTVPGTDGYDN